MPVISRAIRPVFTFADEGLIEYEKIASRRLADIIENLELGENANLQLARQVFLPDTVAKISITVMEGILEPIILVNIDRQESEQRLIDNTQEIGDARSEERLYYSPYFWVGITTVNHTMEDFGENPNCGFFGYSPEGRLIGFEPRTSGGAAFDGDEYGYQNTVESMPGLSYATTSPGWLATHTSQPGADFNRLVPVGNWDTTTYSKGSALTNEGWFGDQDWHLDLPSFSGTRPTNVVRSASGMIATENSTCYATVPPDALRPWGGGNLLQDASLAENYWHRSIIVSSLIEIGGLDEAGDPERRTIVRPSLVLGDNPGAVGAEYSVTYDVVQSAVLSGTVLPGDYEINAFAQNFSCECSSGDVRMRLVIGQRIRELEETTDQFGQVTNGVRYRALIDVIDIEPAGIGGSGTQSRFYFRDLSLGGFGTCDEDQIRGGFSSQAPGLWRNALYVDPLNASWRIGTPSFRSPFYDDPACGETPNQGPTNPDCLGCVGTPVAFNGHGIALIGSPMCIKYEGGFFDLRDACGFHLARVTSVDETLGGLICQVKLVGNDGGAGDCGQPSFSYGFLNQASGIDPSIPLGADLSSYPNRGVVGGWALGQLVVVIGYSNRCTAFCGQEAPGDWRWLVTATNGAGEQFTNLYWSQFRCGNAQAVQQYFNRVKDAATRPAECGDLTAPVRSLEFRDVGGYSAVVAT